uniref:Uncharacterized protein n=6 Tax=Avena sativa TaxID=4498 RepID=A0ACD5Y2C4_AVESA
MARSHGKKILLFLDYDGTLARIVDSPLKEFITREMRETVRDVVRSFPTSIVTGRDVPKAMNFVKLENVHYAGSHGMNIKIIGQQEHYQPLPHLEPIITEATKCLEKALEGVEGALAENNKFCVSVHFRNVDEKDLDLVEHTVNTVLGDLPALKLAHGKMVWELRSAEDFTKGDAVDHLFHYLLQHLQMVSSQVVAIHIGDDRTDEDAFKMCYVRKATGLAFW